MGKWIQLYGEWLCDFKFGIGTEKLTDGTIYTGNFNEDRYNGRGEKLYQNGDYYIGDWINGYKNGNGVYFYDNGNIYVGEYRDNYKYGHGNTIFANGIGEYCMYCDGNCIKIRDLNAEVMAKTRQKVKDF